VEESRMNSILDNLKATISGGHLSKYVSTIEHLLEDTGLANDPDNYITTLDIAAAFLKIAVEQKTTSPVVLESKQDKFSNTGASRRDRSRFRLNDRPNRGHRDESMRLS
jgi:hypothetical protein